MGAVEVRRRAAWRFVRAIVRSQAGGVVGAVLSGLLWQTGAIAAPLTARTTSTAGLGIGTSLDERIDEEADVWAFLLEQLGIEMTPK